MLNRVSSDVNVSGTCEYNDTQLTRACSPSVPVLRSAHGRLPNLQDHRQTAPRIRRGARQQALDRPAGREADSGEAMSILNWIRRRTLSRYADDKTVTGFTRVLDQTKPSAFDVAMDETRKADADAWAKLERDLKREA